LPTKFPAFSKIVLLFYYPPPSISNGDLSVDGVVVVALGSPAVGVVTAG
jgi:hypothetical protein